jgi:hypothetical protein
LSSTRVETKDNPKSIKTYTVRVQHLESKNGTESERKEEEKTLTSSVGQLGDWKVEGCRSIMLDVVRSPCTMSALWSLASSTPISSMSLSVKELGCSAFYQRAPIMQERVVCSPTVIPYSFRGSSPTPPCGWTVSPSSSSSPPGKSFRTHCPSIHSIPSTPSDASTMRIWGTCTPDLPESLSAKDFQYFEASRETRFKHLSSVRASPETRALVRVASSCSCRYFFLNLCLISIGVEPGLSWPLNIL